MNEHWKYALVPILALSYLLFVSIANWELLNADSANKTKVSRYSLFSNVSNVNKCKRLKNLRKIVLVVNYNYPIYDNIQILKRYFIGLNFTDS